MLITLILTFFVTLLNIIFSFLGSVDELPLGMDDVMVSAFGAFHGFLNIFWPLEIIWTCFLTYMGIMLTLWMLRLLRIIR